MADTHKTDMMSRRRFFGYSGAAVAGASLATGMPRNARAVPSHRNMQGERGEFRPEGYREMVRQALAYRKLDAHNHVNESSRDAEAIVRSCDRMGIDRTAVSKGGHDPDSVTEANNVVLAAMKQFPDRIMGQCRIHPGYTRHALNEIDRCIDQGMVMLGELYDDYKINDPVYFPIIERCIELKIPLLVHAAAPLGLWREGYPVANNPPTTSVAEDFVDVGRRYPEAMIIHGHIGGGGDWEYACKVLREAPSIYADTSGSVCDEGMIDLAVECLGVERLLFATDINYETSVGKVMCANLTEADRKKIFFENFNNMLRKAGNHVD